MGCPDCVGAGKVHITKWSGYMANMPHTGEYRPQCVGYTYIGKPIVWPSVVESPIVVPLTTKLIIHDFPTPELYKNNKDNNVHFSQLLTN